MNFETLTDSKIKKSDFSISVDYINIVLNGVKDKKICIKRDNDKIHKSSYVFELEKNLYNHEVYRRCKKE